jgi:predicted Rossmann-fold nucleotide-binding protein
MRSILARLGTRYMLVATALGSLLALALFAVDSDAAVAVEGGADTISETLQQIAVYAIPVAAGILAITIGWRFVRKFFRV